jgi:hypothetical protein
VSAFANHGLRALALAIFALAINVAPAMATPELEVSLTNTPSTLPRSDERMEYTATVKNKASANPSPGTELTCLGTPVDGKLWFGTPTPSFEVEWLRNGELIPGTEAPAAATPKDNTYVVTAADEGKSLQCRITGTSDADGAGTTYAPIAAATVSRPPVVVEPVPSPRPPSGTSQPNLGQGASPEPGVQLECQAPIDWTGFATATSKSGSNVLTNVTTTVGSGTLANGSKVVKNVITTNGAFAAGQTITSTTSAGTPASGIPANTTISGILSPSELELSAAATADASRSLAAGAQPFAVGQPIEGFGIPAGTTITAVEGQKLTLSANLTYFGAASTIALWGPGIGGSSWSFRTLRNGEPIPGATNGTYTVQNADTEPPSILQCEAIAKDAAGNEAVSISLVRRTVPQPPSPYLSPGPAGGDLGRPTITFDNKTEGPVTAELELPSGTKTLVYEAKGAGWSCTSQLPFGETHAKAICTREDALAPGDSYPPITIVARLGEDAPEVGTAMARVTGGGSADATSPAATYTFTEGSSFGMLPGSFLAGVFDEAGNDYTKAGGHPYRAYTTFGFNVHQTVTGAVNPIENIRDVVVDAPRGFQGNALATPELCGTVEEMILGLCPARSAVGGVDVYTVVGSEAPAHNVYPDDTPTFIDVPIYSLEPEFGQPAQFGFVLIAGFGESEVPYTFVPELRPEEGYAISFRTAPILTKPQLWGTNVDLCDFGAKLKQEVGGVGSELQTKFDHCYGATEPGAYPNPLITNPTRCTGPPPTSRLRIDSWQHPEEVKTYDFTSPPITDCDQVKFEPQSSLQPTNHQADSPTGLGVEITMPTDGLLSPTGVGQANLDTATVTFPQGMSINPAAADGLSACTPAQIQLKTNAEAQCPPSSKVGTIEIDTPIIRKTLTGNIYVAKQNDNPFKAALGIYLVFSSKRDGVTIKVAGKLTPDPVTGQLVSTFTENVEAPFSRIAMHFNEGPRAPLINPPKCGIYAIHSEFSPWSAVNPANPTPEEIVSQDSTYEVSEGPNGFPCPSGALEPKLKSGLTNPTAGAKSPFVLTLTREDGSARLTGLEVATPKGLTAYLKGIPYCPDNVLAGISGAEEAGRAELAEPACPAASQVGTVLAGAGAGPLPFQTPGRVYLAGPYKGAPVSLAAVTPAVAGPFDFGNVVIRNALYVNPESAQVTAVSDPIPTILHGILLDVRQIRLALDRPNFTAAPTSCEPMSVDTTVRGEQGATAALSNRFQVGGCERLGFKPKLSLRLFGGTKRGAYPRLKAVLKARPGDANIAGASVALPHSAFLAQEHIRTICTKVQFAADQCPAGSIYGKAEAITPLLDAPLSGPVYLRSSSNPLPDLVVSLRGPEQQPIEVVLAGRVDSVNGGIRNTFDVVPDQPVSSFTLSMQGGKKGLLVNSRDLCSSTSKATAKFIAQNGKRATLRPKLVSSCKKPRKGKKHGAKRQR